MTTALRSGHEETAETRTAPPALPARRRPAMVALAVVLIAAGMLGGAWLLNRQGETVDVLAVSSQLQRGQAIGPTDLTTTTLPAETAGLATVSAADLDQVIGQVATTQLWSGSLLAPHDVAPALRPADGLSVVGVPLTDAQRPAGEIVAGDQVRIVATPQIQGEVSLEEPATFDATVSSVSVTDSGLTVVNVQVPTNLAATLAAHAATERIALVLDPAVE